MWFCALLTGCQSGIGPDQERPRATIAAYETQVGELNRRVRQQDATLASLTPVPASPTPIPLADRWRIDLRGDPTFRPAVGLRDGLTPLAADGVFLVVPISVTNRRSAPAVFSAADRIVAVDGEGRRYDLDPRASDASYLLDFGFEPGFGPRQPGIASPDVLAFDVPSDATGFTIEAIDGSLSLAVGTPRLATPSP